MRVQLRVLHRWLSLALAGLWLVQALTGALLVFRWEIDDAGVAGAVTPLDVEALGARLEALQRRFPQAPIQLYASGGVQNRFDVLLARGGGRLDDLRVDGRGRVLRWRPWNYDFGHVGVLTFAAWLHDTLFAGVAGPWLLALSGALLVSNLVLGLKLAWPRARSWRRSLAPRARAGGGRRLFAWHRALGLWAALAGLLIVTTGALAALDDPIRQLLQAEHQAPRIVPPDRRPSPAPVAAAEALRTGMARYPHARLYSLVLASVDRPWFRIVVRQPGEPERFAGQTAVYVARDGGRIILVDDALKDSARTRALDAVYAIHTGEIAGVIGRGLALATGLALAGVMTLGVLLWLARRRLRHGPLRRSAPRVTRPSSA